MEHSTMKLLIGGHSGIGQSFLEYVTHLGEDVDWLFPTAADLDVRDSFSVNNYISAYGPFDQVVFSAGVSYLEWIGRLNKHKTDDLISVNLTGFIRVIDALVMHQTLTTASVVVVGSDAAERPMRTSISYCASKAGLHMAARAAARELGPAGWRINVVAPGMTDETGMQEYVDSRVMEVRGWSVETMRNYETSQEVVSGRLTKTQVADIIYSTLNGPRHLNGSIITINGGR
jgi:NAD(P)-dependent dehydrogenase (short-subunit alcohol dehydrogenase family)